MVKITYKTGDKVFAKVKGYPPWPARVVSDTGKKKYNVLFYGTQETGAIKPEDLSYYLKHKESYVHKYLKRAGYEDAVKQIEEAIKEDGGDGNDGAIGDDSIQDIDMSDASSVSSVSEKKAPKRKVTSLPLDEPSAKKPSGRGRRKSVAVIESGGDNSEEPASKRPRKKSSASTASKDEEEALEKSKRASDNGIKEDTSVKVQDEVKKGNEMGEGEAEKESIDSGKQVENPAEEPTINNETEESQDANKEDESKDEEKVDKAQSPIKRKAVKKEPESVKIETNADGAMQIEEEPSENTEKLPEKSAVKVEIVTEQLLNNNILYAEHVKKHQNSYADKPLERRYTSKDEVFAVKLPSGTICGVKLHQEWPLSHNSEHDRALYDEKVAKTVLEVRDLLSSGKKAPSEVDVAVIPDIQMTLEDLKEISYARDIESKKKRLERLKKEADLVTWDSKIKNNLGLDKALPDAALESLKEFNRLEKDLNVLMFKKHPHVLDTVRRLRKYVGNVKEWGMSNEDIDSFTRKAEKIRNEAEKIYNKIKNVIGIQEEKGTFWDCFMKLVAEFRTKCNDLSESEVLVLCAEPDSRQAFFDKLDEVTESEGTSLNPSNTSEPVLKETSVQGWSEKK